MIRCKSDILADVNSLWDRDDLVIGAGTNAGALLVDGLGDGILLEAPDQDFEFLRNTSFNLLQGCRMRNTKTVSITVALEEMQLNLNEY